MIVVQGIPGVIRDDLVIAGSAAGEDEEGYETSAILAQLAEEHDHLPCLSCLCHHLPRPETYEYQQSTRQA